MKISDKNLVLFDLDGTLTDPKEGITKAVRYSLKHFGIEADDLEKLTPFIGPPLRASYTKFFNFSAGDAELAVAKYREYYLGGGIFENIMYDGVDTLLQRLTERGKRIVLATSKPTVMAEQVLRHFDLNKYFYYVSGAELDGRRSEKREIIQYAFDHGNIGSPDRAVMIGDREHDVIGAKKTGILSVGVTYGYGSHEELTNSGADHIVSSVEALGKLLLHTT